MRRWQIQDARTQLSELVKSSEREGPQEITVRGRPAAVVLSIADYERLRRKGIPCLAPGPRRDHGRSPK